MKIDIPSTQKIFEKAIFSIKKFEPEINKKKYLENHFSEAVELIFNECYKIYQWHEGELITKEINLILKKFNHTLDTPKLISDFAKEISIKSIQLEKSLSQSRRPRAGITFEIIIRYLLLKFDITSQKVTKRYKKSGLKRIDLVIPDISTAINSPDQAHFLALKTTLRNRYKEVFEDQKPGQRTHLLTLLQNNEPLSDQVIEDIHLNGIFVYVPDSIKNRHFSKDKRVRKLSDLPTKVG